MNIFLKLTLLALFIYAFFLMVSFFLKTKKNARVFERMHRIILLILIICVTVLGVYLAFFRNISFANPWVLLLIIPVLIFACLYPLVEKQKPSISYNLAYALNTKTVKITLARYLAFALNILAVCLVIAALARPRNVDRTVIPPVEGVEIMLTLDTSLSMTANDFMPNRMEAAKQAASAFVEKRSTDKIGIVVFGGSAMLMCPVTFDYDALQDFLADVKVNMMNDSGTAIGDAIATSVAHLQNSKSKTKVIILLTDGASNTGSITPLLAAESAKTFGIKIYTIATIGLNAKEEFDEGLLRTIAADTGGKYFRAYDAKSLNQIYAEINMLEKTEFKPSVIVNYKDRYTAPLTLALILLFLSLLLNKFVFVRIP